jgi:hypothetical protein
MSDRMDGLRDALRAAIDMSREHPGLVRPEDVLHAVSCNMWELLNEIESLEQRIGRLEDKP